MPSIRTIVNLTIFTASVVLVVFGVWWYEGYQKAKKSDSTIHFTDYVKTDLKNIKGGIETIPDLLSDVAASGDEMRKSYVDRMAEVLEMYAQDKGKYPKDVRELVPGYINQKALNQQGFYYKKFGKVIRWELS